MKWIIKYCLICTFLLGIFSTRSYSKEGIFSFPDKLASEGKWLEACIELEKVIFLFDEKEIQTQAIIKKALCHKHEHDFEKVAETLNRVYLFRQPDSIVFMVKYEKAMAYYLNNEPGKAIFELQSLQSRSWRKEDSARIMLLTSLGYLAMQEWEESQKSAEAFLAIAVATPTKQALYKAHLAQLFSEKNIPKQLSPKKAKNLARFIPGAGHFYTGKIGEGLMSFSLHAGLLYFGIDQFSNKFYFTGYTAGFGLLQRLYSGNLERVQHLAEEVNNEKNTQFYTALFQFLSEASGQMKQ